MTEPLLLPTRRGLLHGVGRVLMGAGMSATLGGWAHADDEPRQLSLVHLHTAERLRITYWQQNGYVGSALSDVNHFLRDWRTSDVAPIDPRLLDLLHALQRRLRSTEAFNVICGYRSPQTNATLAERSASVSRHSLHMEGRAIDIDLPSRPLATLCDEALAMAAGGVGFYPASGFVHVDTGRPRRWG